MQYTELQKVLLYDELNGLFVTLLLVQMLLRVKDIMVGSRWKWPARVSQQSITGLFWPAG